MIRIRPVKTVDEYLACEDLQKQVWHFEDREVVPKNELIAIQLSGGVVLGAFEGERMVGFTFGLPGVHQGVVYLSSRMLAVLPAVRNRGLGHRLKLAQRAHARRMGFPLVTWTFDPLQSLNAYLNIEKLGVVVREYLVNLYGTMTSPLSRGMDTDRFVPEWWVTSRRVTEVLAGRRPKLEPARLLGHAGWASANGTRPDDGVRLAGPVHTGLREQRLLVEIPAEIQAVKSRSLDAARQWRIQTRRVFLHYLGRGYVVTRFASGPVDGERRSFYVLEKDGAAFGLPARARGRI